MKAARAALGLVSLFAATYAVAQGTLETRRSGYQDMGPALKQMQDDDMANPGMLFVQLGAQVWARPAGASGKSCADCHGAASSMKGVAARYPALPPGADKPSTSRRLNLCRTTNQQAEPWRRKAANYYHVSFVAGNRAGCRLPPGPALFRFASRGRDLPRRQGQLNLSCAICHDDNAGRNWPG
jgi:sulfur-oxidizing protein SoxA